MGGWRVAIVDPIDELNKNGENALLKVLEEPPPRAFIWGMTCFDTSAVPITLTPRTFRQCSTVASLPGRPTTMQRPRRENARVSKCCVMAQPLAAVSIAEMIAL